MISTRVPREFIQMQTTYPLQRAFLQSISPGRCPAGDSLAEGILISLPKEQANRRMGRPGRRGTPRLR